MPIDKIIGKIIYNQVSVLKQSNVWLNFVYIAQKYIFKILARTLSQSIKDRTMTPLANGVVGIESGVITNLLKFLQDVKLWLII